MINLIKQYREEAGLTQAQLALELGVTQTMVSMLEAGTRNCSRDLSLKLSDLLKMPNEFLIKEDNLQTKITRNIHQLSFSDLELIDKIILRLLEKSVETEEPTTDIIYCKDCQYCETLGSSYSLDYICKHRPSKTTNLVTPWYDKCCDERFNGLCGKSAKNFLPIEKLEK
jgi:transcriptional regulator with XRE-family HTH domain